MKKLPYPIKYRRAALLLALALLLGGCGTAPGGEGPAPELVAAAISARQGIGEMTAIRQGDDAFSDYLTQRYDIDPAQVEDGCIRIAGGVDATEITVLLLKDRASAGAARDALDAYREKRAGAFTGYAPEQAAMAEAGAALAEGSYAALLICPDPESASALFRAGVRGEAELSAVGETAAQDAASQTDETAEPMPDTESAAGSEFAQEPEKTAEAEPTTEPEPVGETEATQEPEATTEPEPAPAQEAEDTAEPLPAEDTAEPEPAPEADGDAYDHDAVVAAWRSGDESALTEKNRAILEGARTVMSWYIREDMSDYEKELALHDWMVEHAEYDPGELSSNPYDIPPDPDNDNPYGFFYSGKGVCLGYSSTFQLFMDLVGIECITVHGTARQTEPHAWNMVRLEGEWYCVDVTWDDPVSSYPVPAAYHHRYFNVVSDLLRATDHQWDEEQTPEATATAMAWRG